MYLQKIVLSYSVLFSFAFGPAISTVKANDFAGAVLSLEAQNSTILGTWRIHERTVEGNPDDESFAVGDEELIFQADGTCTIIDHTYDKTDTGTWTMSGDNLTIECVEAGTMTYLVRHLSASQLELQLVGVDVELVTYFSRED